MTTMSGLHLGRDHQRLMSLGCFGADLPAGDAFDQGPQAPADNRMVVDEHVPAWDPKRREPQNCYHGAAFKEGTIPTAKHQSGNTTRPYTEMVERQAADHFGSWLGPRCSQHGIVSGVSAELTCVI